MPIAKIVRWCAMISVTLLVLDRFGIAPASLWQAGKNRLENFKNDTQELTSGEAANAVSQRMKSEIHSAQSVDIADDREMSKELQAERTRVMEAKFNALQNPQLIRPPQGGLSEQVERNARNAAGLN